jgi:hypothetical protein
MPSCQPTISILRPDIFVSVKEDSTRDIEQSKEYKTLMSYGGKVVMLERQSPFVSTTAVIERMIGSHLGEILEKYTVRMDEPIKEKFQTLTNGHKK